ncbi:MAG: AAA family ATPase, partial [Clostridia bacterium]|nr:AAA family ATPase [Clostridia bacterium]
QNEAVNAVANAIKRSRVGLKDTNKPIGSFIFVGQTGIGKTELCRALAESMFNDENAIIKLDMSEFMEAHSVSKLIGAPAGYVGYQDGGLLTDAVRRKPYSVVLFDEIEKAHKDVFNLMLQVLDEGKLTDSKGNVVNFKNTIIIFTSNIGVEKLPAAKKLLLEKGKECDFEVVKEVLINALKGHFKPEFLNRIDQTIVFEPLKNNELAQIAKIMIIKLNNKLKTKKLELKLTESAFKHLIKNGTNDEYGARPLRRVIEKEVEDKLTQDMLTGNLLDGRVIIIDLENNALTFKYVAKN